MGSTNMIHITYWSLLMPRLKENTIEEGLSNKTIIWPVISKLIK